MSENSDTIICSNCHSPMPSALRFCRNCGFRLGTSYGDSGQFGGAGQTGSAPIAIAKKRRRFSGMTWIFVGLIVFFVGAAAFTAVLNPMRHRNVGAFAIKPPVTKAFIGVDGLDTTDNGVTFGSIDAPNGPADKAGLVGGDVITKFDGQDIHNEDQMHDLLEHTPIGKTVAVEHLRDGQKKTTQLTKSSQDEFKRLVKEYDKRPEGKGQFGYDDDESERVQVPGKNIYGVKLNSLLRSRPADMAGIKEGDIVTEFDGVPIRTTDEFLTRVKRAEPYSTVKVVVVRDGQEMEIPVKMGKQ